MNIARVRPAHGVPVCPDCTYHNAWWVACTGLGEGLGYRICSDCMIPGDCASTCGCRSDVLCRRCTTPADVRAEMAHSMAGDD